MISSIFEKDRISRFAKQIKPGVLPKLGIEHIDTLLGFPSQNLPTSADLSRYPENIRDLCSNLNEVSDSDAGLAMAALMVMAAKNHPTDRAKEFFWRLRDGAATWSPKTAVAMLQFFQERENGLADSYTGEILRNSFPRGMPKHVQTALESLLDNLKVPEHGLRSYQKNQIEELEILVGRDPEKNPAIKAQNQLISDYLKLQSEIMPLFGPLMRPAIDRLKKGEDTGYQS